MCSSGHPNDVVSKRICYSCLLTYHGTGELAISLLLCAPAGLRYPDYLAQGYRADDGEKEPLLSS